MSRLLRALTAALVSLTVVGFSAAAVQTDSPDTSPKVAKTTQKPTKKKTKGKKRATKAMPTEAGGSAAAAGGALKFSRDVAPILVANCLGCHNPKQKRGKLDMTTFEKMMEGTPAEKIIAPGKPDESEIVLRIKGEKTPKMPQGANRNLSEAAITKITEWVKAGAVLDAGIDPKATLETFAAKPEDLRKGALAKLSAEERDKQVEAVGLERWKKANPKVKPDVASNTHFMIFSTNLPKERATGVLKALEGSHTQVKSMLGPAAVDLGEKASLYVFGDNASFTEFVRVIENREVEPRDVGTAKFTVPQPYVAVVAPQGGGGGSKEDAGAAKKGGGGRLRRSEDGGTVERTLDGLLTEYYVIGAASRNGRPPRWVTLGLGAWYAAKIETKSGYGQALRRQAAAICQLGWQPKANEALGDATKTEEVRAVGFALIDWMSTVARNALPVFVQGMQEGGEKLDDVIAGVLNGTREQFLVGSGEFIMQKYGQP